jgi:hypothetical protein
MASIKLKNFTISNNYSKLKNIKFIRNLMVKKANNSSLLYLKNNFDLNRFKEDKKITKFSEPEDHIKIISKLITNKFKFKKIDALGATSKDLSLLKQINQYNKESKIKIFSKKNSLEKSIDNFNKHKIKKKYNIIILRHIWEHITNQKKFFLKLKSIIAPKHLIYIEVPDCKNLIKKLDYTMIWEEHRYYYTKETIIEELENLGFQLILFKRVPHPQEDNLCLLVKLKDNVEIKYKKNKKLEKLSLNYLKSLKLQRVKTNIFFKNLKKQKKKIVFYGATHMLNTFLNIYKLKNVEYLIDDNLNKKGKFFSLLKKPIINFEKFKKEGLSKCVIFISCNISLEDKITKKLTKFKNICKIYSIFPNSKKYYLIN